jgi:gliding motility-associated-like protein
VPSICETDTLKLFATDVTPGVSYSWAGPNSFTSTLQNPVIPNVTTAANGSYTVTVNTSGTCTNFAVIVVSVTMVPPVTATSNSPVCTGVNDTLFLHAVAPAGSTFTWGGPYTFYSTNPNPQRTPVEFEYGGIYQVTAFLNGCQHTVNDTVVVIRTPAPPWVTDLTYCQYYLAAPLMAGGENILWYPTDTANGIGSSTPPLPPTANDTVMWFFLTQTVDGCISALDSMKVTVNPKPHVWVTPADTAICPRDSVMLTAHDIDPIAYYSWSPSMYLNTTAGAEVMVHPETDIHYTVVASNQFNCTDTAVAMVWVHPEAVIHLGDSVTLYPGETFQLNPQGNCTAFMWTPPGGLSDPYISNPVASPAISTKYVLYGQTAWGCATRDSINIYVETESLLALPNAFTPGNGVNKEFKVMIKGLVTLKYFRIWNRWGQVVFETTDATKGWDGTFNGEPQPEGVFVYQVQGVTSTDHVVEKHGNVTLIR